MTAADAVAILGYVLLSLGWIGQMSIIATDRETTLRMRILQGEMLLGVLLCIVVAPS